LEIFFGDVSDAMCRVYARCLAKDVEGCTLGGSLTGPACAYAHTLPATLPLVDRGPGDAPLAAAYVPEPCFWTPDMPQLYRARIQLYREGRVLASAERIMGIRALGATGRKLVYDAKRWVLRGVRAVAVPPTDLETWRGSGTAMIVSNPSDSLCEQASRVGVLLVAEIDAFDPREIRRLSRWPAVGMVILPCGSRVEPGGLRHNLLLAERFDIGQSIAPAAWAQAAICEVLDPDEFSANSASCPIAVIALRFSDGLASVADGRSRCDRVQSDLAGRGDLAGYIV
jgi:hypothetical protein